jgi:hypothetical protein
MLGVLCPGVHLEGDVPSLPKKLSGMALTYQWCAALFGCGGKRCLNNDGEVTVYCMDGNGSWSVPLQDVGR